MGLCFGVAPSHMDVRLDWLIANSGIEQGDAFRRLNAIENQLANLASQWRQVRPILPATELRMSEATREQLVTMDGSSWHGRDPRARRAACHLPLRGGTGQCRAGRLATPFPERLRHSAGIR